MGSISPHGSVPCMASPVSLIVTGDDSAYLYIISGSHVYIGYHREQRGFCGRRLL